MNATVANDATDFNWWPGVAVTRFIR